MPFRFDPYQDRFADSIAARLARRGDIAAQQALTVGEAQARGAAQSGNAWAGALSNVGQAVAAIPGQIQASKRLALQEESDRLAIAEQQQKAADRNALDAAYKMGDRDAVLNAAPGHLKPMIAKQYADMDASAMKLQKARADIDKLNNDYLAGLGASVAEHGYDLTATGLALQHARNTYEQANDPQMVQRIDQIAQQLSENPDSIKSVVDGVIALSPERVKMRETTRHNEVTEAQGGQRLELEGERVGLQKQAMTFTEQARIETERHNKAMEGISRLTVGRQDAAQAETARHNRAMEENARNAKVGRPVIAGDAEDLANFDTSRDELKVLKDAITAKGETGTIAKMGASAPNWVTDLTGWGTDAKKKQALIDRVKQVIGKALEGGVLRKEDELKYEKILPTIGDTNEVVKSKLDGLDSALQERKTRRLDAMEDAGFNVSRFKNREAGAPAEGTSRTVGDVTATWKNGPQGWGWYK